MVPEVKSLHIELTNICTLKCPGCSRTEFLNSPIGKYWKNQNLNYQQLDKFLNIDLSGIELSLCGTYGDPIYYPDLFEFIKTFKARGARIKLVTNGSHKKKEWWQELCSLLNLSDEVVFSIDGTPKNFTQYRVNGDWQTIEDAIKTCVANKVPTRWKYLIFKYNQDNIKEVEELASSLGVNRFQTSISHRFHNDLVSYQPSNIKHISEKFFTQTTANNEIDPECYHGKHHYISADGFYVPCCYMAEHNFYYKTQFGKERKEYSIDTNILTEILSKPATVEFYNNIEVFKPNVCQYQCPKINKNT